MRHLWIRSTAWGAQEQDLYVLRVGDVVFYCFIIFDRTRFQREVGSDGHRPIVNWQTTVTAYVDSQPVRTEAVPLVDRSVDPLPTVEAIVDYALNYATPIAERWVSQLAPDYGLGL